MEQNEGEKFVKTTLENVVLLFAEILDPRDLVRRVGYKVWREHGSLS